MNKPAGQEFHGESGILAELRQGDSSRYGVHRLDKDTSGIIIFAKSKKDQRELSSLFEKRKIKKLYVALSRPKPSKKQGRVKGDLKKSRNGNYKICRSLENPSITDFKSYGYEELGLRVFCLAPLTGKTHQLRVVMKSLGSSILGDRRYQGEEADRLYLHACQIEFSLYDENYHFSCYPESGEYFTEPGLNSFIKNIINNDLKTLK